MDIDKEKLHDLVGVLAAAKVHEEIARFQRIEAEEAIAALIPSRETGQATVSFDDGTSVTVKRGLNYKADFEKMEKKCLELGCYAPIKHKTTAELDSVNYELYRINDPENFHALSEFVSATPKKVAVSMRAKK